MAVRMRDVAESAGVSTATVSLALAGDPRISPGTRNRVLGVARELGYRPHAGARSLRTDATRALGLVVGDVANPFFGELAAAVEREAARRGHTVVLCNADEDTEQQDRYLESLLGERKVDGVMIVASSLSPSLISALHAGARLVFVDRPVTGEHVSTDVRDLLKRCPLVRADGATAIREATRHLLELGHQRFAAITGPLSTAVGRERRDLFMTALLEAGIEARDIHVAEGDFRQASAETAMAHLLALERRPTAVFASDNLMALGCLRGARRAGLTVPDNVSIVGYDDAPWFELLDPPLSTIAQPVAEIGQAAVTALIDVIADRSPTCTQFPCHYLPRASTGPAPLQEGAGGSRGRMSASLSPTDPSGNGEPS